MLGYELFLFGRRGHCCVEGGKEMTPAEKARLDACVLVHRTELAQMLIKLHLR